jgi:HPt (histidine-containing phosphotransfer) domain-containing protein
MQGAGEFDFGQHDAGLGGARILDPEVIDGLLALGGDDDPGLLGELIEMYLDDAEQRMTVMLAALESGDCETVGKAAHALKSASANMGALEFSKVCLELEQNATSGVQQGEMAPRVQNKYSEVASVMTRLKSFTN